MTHSVQSSRARARALRSFVAVAALSAAGALSLIAPAARAGIYTVPGACGQWSPFNADGSRIAVYADCPSLIARNTGGAFTTGAGVAGGWRFDPPAGTEVVSVELHGSLQGVNGWQATAYTEGTSARELINCPGGSCPGASAIFQGTYPTYNSGAVVLRVRCGASGGCTNRALGGQIYLNSASVTLADYSFPTATLASGSLLRGGWRSGTQTLVVDGTDNIGIREARALVDGSRVANAGRDCRYGEKVPCSNGPTSLAVPTRGLADGSHEVSGEAVDASGNVAQSPGVTVHVDNTAPTQPLDLAVAGAAGWRAVNVFKLSWRNPLQRFAPIAGVRYQLCPSLPVGADQQSRVRAQARCVQGGRDGIRLTAINNLKLPSPGLWDLKLWLLDSAGNQLPASADEIDGLGFDDTPPSGLAFVDSDPQDPARVRLQASDAVSGLASGAIEVRRYGQNAWQPLSTRVTSRGATAFMDDEVLPKGLYFLRARVADAAGLEASTDRKADGQPATIKLPIRLASHLRAGRRADRRCRGERSHRRCRYRLARKPKLQVGRATRLYGRLTVAGKAMPATQLDVWRRVDLQGAKWTRIGMVSTSRTGRFSYRARRGPARTIRFRYPGTNTIRGRNGDVALRVRAATTLRPHRRSVINGEYVTFRGRLKGGWIPTTGALVELQVRSRGQWRTFAQPRANAKTGRWEYRYRFGTVSGQANFRIRARVRRQPGFPFTTGASRPIRVRVRGL